MVLARTLTYGYKLSQHLDIYGVAHIHGRLAFIHMDGWRLHKWKDFIERYRIPEFIQFNFNDIECSRLHT
jgi:hypothetical protein